MRILLVWDFLKPLEDFFDISKMKLREEDKLAIILPAKATRVIIDKDNLIKYEVKCVFNQDKQAPRITPKDLDDLNVFLKEFKPDLIHSFDCNLLGLMTQNYAINNKIKYLLSNNGEINKKFNREFFESINGNCPLNIEQYIKTKPIKAKKRPANFFWLILAIIGGVFAFFKLKILNKQNGKPKQ